MINKHTPGPWVLKGARVYEASPGIDCIATMQVSNQQNWCADARLIAAAPDLLVALDAAHHMLCRDYIDDAKMAVIRKCAAAIAKATTP